MHAPYPLKWLAAFAASSLVVVGLTADSIRELPIKISLTAAGERWQNVAGGAQTGAGWNMLLDRGARAILRVSVDRRTAGCSFRPRR